jgi:hypothetical protein
MSYSWARKHPGGYECSSRGDVRFSAFGAKLSDGRSIEHWYQCDVKGYDPRGRNWQRGKGQPSLIPWPEGHQYELYKSLWKFYFLQHPELFDELKAKADEHGKVLTDMFATTDINQARALADILNEWS